MLAICKASTESGSGLGLSVFLVFRSVVCRVRAPDIHPRQYGMVYLHPDMV